MKVEILSLFPDFFKSPLEQSILKRAMDKGLLHVSLHDIRDWTHDPHKRVDDRPYGGGPGMVMTPQPVVDSVRAVSKPNSKVILLSPQGKPLNAEICRRLSREEHLVFLCGHYEGIDERAIEEVVDEEISIGDYVLTSGCGPALILLDATTRLIPGVLGHEDAADQDSFENGLLDCPHYTRPEVYMDKRVPSVLLGGDHQKIAKWRTEQSEARTRDRRPDLL